MRLFWLSILSIVRTVGIEFTSQIRYARSIATLKLQKQPQNLTEKI